MSRPKIAERHALVEVDGEGIMRLVFVGERREVWSLYTQARKLEGGSGVRSYIMPALCADVGLEERSRALADRVPRMLSVRVPKPKPSKPRKVRS